MEDTDKSLVEAHLKGDATAFAVLLRRHGPSVLGYLTNFTGSRHQAEDLFQGSDLFRPWLFQIATRVAISSLRRRKRMKTVSLNKGFDCPGGQCRESGSAVAADNSSEPSLEAIKAEQRQQVRQALQSLPPRQRTTLVLAYYQQLSYREVAEVLGCSLGTVKTQMYRALRTLAAKLPDVSGETL
ncbi:MAG: RNA polymerase sigma factor [Planctomycetota bacterium]|jgi:RNA polymerase sigma-70 factor (ECF subfamily)